MSSPREPEPRGSFLVSATTCLLQTSGTGKGVQVTEPALGAHGVIEIWLGRRTTAMDPRCPQTIASSKASQTVTAKAIKACLGTLGALRSDSQSLFKSGRHLELTLA